MTRCILLTLALLAGCHAPGGAATLVIDRSVPRACWVDVAREAAERLDAAERLHGPLAPVTVRVVGERPDLRRYGRRDGYYLTGRGEAVVWVGAVRALPALEHELRHHREPNWRHE